jgi:hypothetical protein
MFIVWGKKHVYRKMGFVADFCPLCRNIRPFRLDRVGLADHVYYVTVSRGELVGYAKKCMNCKTILNGNPDLYREVSKKLLEPTELQRSTFPDLQTKYAERLTLEQTIKHSPGSLPADTRSALLREPFILLNPIVEQRFSSTQIDKYTGLTLLAMFVLMPFISIMGKQFAPTYEGEIFLGFLIAGIAAVAVQGFLQTGRYFGKIIFPVLVPALKPLKPTAEEMTAVIAELKKADREFGMKLKLPALWERLQQ